MNQKILAKICSDKVGSTKPPLYIAAHTQECSKN